MKHNVEIYRQGFSAKFREIVASFIGTGQVSLAVYQVGGTLLEEV
jgi:hypothetical protein